MRNQYLPRDLVERKKKAKQEAKSIERKLKVVQYVKRPEVPNCVLEILVELLKKDGIIYNSRTKLFSKE